jgi:four helix bundle protein
MAAKLRVLDAARAIADEINVLIACARPRLLHPGQLSESAGSIAANIREGYGKDPGPERNVFLRHARASAEETDEHLRRNLAAGRLHEATFWRLHHRLSAISKMLTSLMRRAAVKTGVQTAVKTGVKTAVKTGVKTARKDRS